MKRIWTVFLILCLTFSLGVTAFAAENESQDVYAKYIEADTNGAEAPVEDGKAEVELPDGTEVEVGDLPEDVKTVEVVPIPRDEAEAIEWFENVIEGEGTEPQPYIILVTDKDGNEEKANGVTVTMDIPEGINDPIVIAVDSDGGATELPATVKDGKITFEADGSDFYVVAEKAASTDPGTDTPDDPDDPDDPVNPPSTGDDTIIWPWILLAVIACGLIFFLIFWKRRKKDENKA